MLKGSSEHATPELKPISLDPLSRSPLDSAIMANFNYWHYL
jgi:hypothetical protein